MFFLEGGLTEVPLRREVLEARAGQKAARYGNTMVN